MLTMINKLLLCDSYIYIYYVLWCYRNFGSHDLLVWQMIGFSSGMGEVRGVFFFPLDVLGVSSLQGSVG